MREVSLIVDEPATGSWNMSVDEALLRRAAEEGVSTLRFYQWSEPTLSLGYFQEYEQRKSHPSSLTCPVVRRASGGGAIMHDRELTYSYCIPVDRRDTFNSETLYDAFHGTLVDVLRAEGVDCEQVGEDSVASSPQPFLCFQRRAAADIVVFDTKIAGSAQRKQRGALLQHGSILLKRSSFAPELLGLERWTTISCNELVKNWLRELEDRLELRALETTLPSGVSSRAVEIEATKFGHSNWTQRR